ncbi:MAG TPA: lysostaphin resistance A-like protein [Candidatus Brocadiaceae bacterium]
MILFNNLKQYKKILLLFLLILCLSSLLAPLLKILLDACLPSNHLLADLLNYEQGSYDFGRVMRRIITGVTILVVFLFRKTIKIGHLTTSGIIHTHEWQSRFQTGFLLGAGMFIFYTTFLYTNGTKVLDVDAKSMGDFFIQLIKILLAAGIIGCIEEVFFRGFIFQSFLEDMHAMPAMCFSSLFYAMLHFFKIKSLVLPGIQPFIGFLVIYQFFQNIAVHFISNLPSLGGLVLVGIVLSYACLRTKSLYFAVGLHTAWVFLIKTNKILFDHKGSKLTWLFGDSNVVTGVLGWGLLIVTLILIKLATSNSDLKPHIAQTKK